MMSKKSDMKDEFVKIALGGDIPRSNVYWKEVLDEIFNRVPSAFGPGKFKNEDENPIAKKLKISDWELYRNVIFLQEIGLIQIKNEGKYQTMWPTGKGFDVALQNEKNKMDIKLKKVTISLTAMIALTTIFTFLLTTGKYDSDFHKQMILIFYLIGIVFIAYYNKGFEFITYIKKKL